MSNHSRVRTARRITALLACIITLFWVGASTAAFSPFYARCNTNNLRVRKTVGTSGAIQGYLMDKDVVWVVDSQKKSGTTYYQMEYIDQFGARQTGWVVYSDSKSVYFHKFTDNEMTNYRYKSGDLPGSGTSSSNTGSGTSSSSSNSNYGYLKLGSKGDAVKKLQQKLKDIKMYSGDVSGSFGQLTEDAVKAYQRKIGVYVDGIAGPDTQAKLFGTDSGSSGSSGGSNIVINNTSNLGMTLFDKVNLRRTASTSGASKSLLPKGLIFTIVSYSRSGNEVWYYVDISGSKGYIRSDMMYVLTAEEAAAYNSGQNPNVPTATPGATATPAPTLVPGATATPAPTVAPSTQSGYARIKSNDVNIRSGASTGNSSLAKLKKDDVLQIGNSTTNSAGELWYYLIRTSLEGYVRSDFVYVMTQAEIDAYLNTTDNSGSTSGSYRTLKRGSTGEDVKALQQKLKDLNYYTGSVTGNFGSATEEAVKRYQKAVGLYVDGIAGANTQNKLFGTNYNTDGTAKPVINGVENLDWNVFKSTVAPTFKNAVLTDVVSGKSFNIVKQSAGYHLDVEPATAADTAVLTSIYNGNITYVRRAVWLTVGSRTFAASIYAVPHGTDTIPGNNFAGQFCVHLLNSMTHVGSAKDPEHQACVEQAYQAAKNKL